MRMIALGPIFQAIGAVVDLIIEAVENFSDDWNEVKVWTQAKSFSACWLLSACSPTSLTMIEHKNTDSSEPVFFEHVNRVYPSETTRNYVNRVVFELLQYVKMCGDPIAINHVSTAQ